MSVCVLRVHVCAHSGCTHRAVESSANDFFLKKKYWYFTHHITLHKVNRAYRIIIVKNFK